MAPRFIRQAAFDGGELSPQLWGRHDLPTYARGLRYMLNFFPSKQGMAVSRGGTSFIRATKNSGGSNTGVRLIPFIVNSTTSYVLEFGHYYVRFHTAGATVLSGGVPLELVTPYTEANIWSLQYVQSGDVLTLTSPQLAPQELRHNADGSWSFNAIAWAPLEAVSYAPGIGYMGIIGYLLQAPPPGGTAPNDPFTPDSTHQAREWDWRISANLQTPDGRLVETLSVPITKYVASYALVSGALPINGQPVVCYYDRPCTLILSDRGPAIGTTPTGVVQSFNVYRGRGTLFGFVGTTNQRLGDDSFTFKDIGDAPNYALQPLQGTDPRQCKQPNGSTLVDTFATSTYFQQRRIFAGSYFRPGWVFASSIGAYNDFDSHLITTEDQALAFELASNKRDPIRFLIGAKNRLLALTDSNCWLIGGTQGAPMSPTNLSAQVEIEKGVGGQVLLTLPGGSQFYASVPAPMMVDGGSVLYVGSKGRSVIAAITDTNASFPQGLVGVDLTSQAQHLFHGNESAANATPYATSPKRNLIDWCYADEPWGLVWAVRADGRLLSLSFNRGQGSHGWAQHPTTGTVRSVCSVPEVDEDVVYLAVQRPGGVYVECMNSRRRNDSPEDDAAVDACLRYRGPPAQTLTGLGHLEGLPVYAVSRGNPPYGPMIVSGGTITLPELPVANAIDAPTTDIVMFVGLLYQCELDALDAVDVAKAQKQVVSVRWEVDQARGLFTGQDQDHLTEWRQRQVTDSYLPPANSTQLIVVPVNGTWDRYARAILRQTLPLPVTVVGLTREVDVGG
jgi:hypothetical protein